MYIFIYFFDELNPFLDVTRTKFRRRPNTVLSFRRKFTLQIGMSARERDSASRLSVGVRIHGAFAGPHVFSLSLLPPILSYHLRRLPFVSIAQKTIRAEWRSCFHQAIPVAMSTHDFLERWIIKRGEHLNQKRYSH